MSIIPKDTADKTLYPEISAGVVTLDRFIKAEDRVLCKCDGTSREVRACLASSNTIPKQWPEGQTVSESKDRRPAKSHEEVVLACANAGIRRLNEMLNNSSR